VGRLGKEKSKQIPLIEKNTDKWGEYIDWKNF
jgi:hypothetical protein